MPTLMKTNYCINCMSNKTIKYILHGIAVQILYLNENDIIFYIKFLIMKNFTVSQSVPSKRKKLLSVKVPHFKEKTYCQPSSSSLGKNFMSLKLLHSKKKEEEESTKLFTVLVHSQENMGSLLNSFCASDNHS